MGKEEREKCTLVCLIIGPGQIFQNICQVSYLNLVLYLTLHYQAINYYQLEFISRLNQSTFYPMHFDTSSIRVKDFDITDGTVVI